MEWMKTYQNNVSLVFLRNCMEKIYNIGINMLIKGKFLQQRK